MNRIDKLFAEYKAENKKAFISFIMAGDPDLDSTLELMNNFKADILEIGMPFSDPMADGPVIQEAAIRSLSNNINLHDILGLVKKFRQNSQKPVILMGYLNPIHHYGVEKFLEDAKTAGVDGLIIVDLPPEEDIYFEMAKDLGINIVRLLTPTTDERRLEKILQKSKGFLYYVSVAGVTGTKTSDINDVKAKLEFFKSKTDLPIGVGFGIKTVEQVQANAAISDAVIVGSEIVKTISSEGLSQAIKKENELANSI